MTLLEVLLNSKEIKRMIVKRSSDYNIPLRYLCREAGIDYNLFMRSYINALDQKAYEGTEEDLRKVLDTLGIKIRYQFVIDETIDLAEKSRLLTNKYEEKRRNGQ